MCLGITHIFLEKYESGLGQTVKKEMHLRPAADF
jgi:hypothetical protein